MNNAAHAMRHPYWVSPKAEQRRDTRMDEVAARQEIQRSDAQRKRLEGVSIRRIATLAWRG